MNREGAGQPEVQRGGGTLTEDWGESSAGIAVQAHTACAVEA